MFKEPAAGPQFPFNGEPRRLAYTTVELNTLSQRAGAMLPEVGFFQCSQAALEERLQEERAERAGILSEPELCQSRRFFF